MQTFNDESMILDCFRDIKPDETALFGNYFVCKKIFFSLKSFLFRKNWINSFAKNDPPPDFYNDRQKLMMDVMRIDDHAFVDDKGRVQNANLQREGEIYRKYFQGQKRDDIKLFFVPDTHLPTKEDHNFDRYIANFERVFNKHQEKLGLYQSNHPGYKTIFFIFDESTAYRQVVNPKDVETTKQGREVLGMPHYYCYDKAFVDAIKKSNIDYVVWFAPYKVLQYKKGNRIKIFPLPKCAIYDVKNIREKRLIKYERSLLSSAEE